MRRGEEPKPTPPRVIVSISGEAAGQEGNVEWSAAVGKPFDVSDPPTGTTYIGRCVGKQLFISDVDEKKKKVEALVKVIGPTGEDEPERVIGTFPSRSIKVISKPSKKRQSAKNLECTSPSSPRDLSITASRSSVYQSRIHNFPLPSTTISNCIDQISLCLWFWLLIQGVRWRPLNGY